MRRYDAVQEVAQLQRRCHPAIAVHSLKDHVQRFWRRGHNVEHIAEHASDTSAGELCTDFGSTAFWV